MKFVRWYIFGTIILLFCNCGNDGAKIDSGSGSSSSASVTNWISSVITSTSNYSTTNILSQAWLYYTNIALTYYTNSTNLMYWGADRTDGYYPFVYRYTDWGYLLGNWHVDCTNHVVTNRVISNVNFVSDLFIDSVLKTNIINSNFATNMTISINYYSKTNNYIGGSPFTTNFYLTGYHIISVSNVFLFTNTTHATNW